MKMKKIILIAAMLLTFVSSSFAFVNKPAVFGIMLTDGIEIAKGKAAPNFLDEGGYRTNLALTFNSLVAFTPEFALHPAIGLDLRMFSYTEHHRDDFDISMAITLPIMARFYMTDIFFGELGPIFDINLFEAFSDGREWRKEKYQKAVYIGLNAELGLTFDFGLEIGFNYTHGFTNLYKDNDKFSYNRINFNIGYWFNYR